MEIYDNYLKARRELLNYLGFSVEKDSGDFSIVDCTMFYWELDKGRISEELAYLVYYRTLEQARNRDEDNELMENLGRRKGKKYLERVLLGKELSAIWMHDDAGDYLQIFDNQKNLTHYGITSIPVNERY